MLGILSIIYNNIYIQEHKFTIINLIDVNDERINIVGNSLSDWILQNIKTQKNKEVLPVDG